MSFKVRCIKHKLQEDKWVLEGGRIYSATKINDNEIVVLNHYGEFISLTPKEFKIYCVVIG